MRRPSFFLWKSTRSSILLLISFLIFFGNESLKHLNAADPVRNGEFTEKIISDWEQQEQEKKRTLYSADALTDLIQRSKNLLNYLQEEEYISQEKSNVFSSKIAEAQKTDPAQLSVVERFQKYIELRTILRDVIFDIPLIKNKPIIFLKENRFVCQMLHEYMSYYYEKSGINGGGLYILKEPGRSFETRDLTAGKFPKGVFSTMNLSYDGKIVYFSYADLSKVQKEGAPLLNSRQLAEQGPAKNFVSEYMIREEGKFHLFQMDLETGKIRQLTAGPNDDFSPLPLPDGDLVFLSTRREGFGRCHGGWEPLAVHTLHRLKLKGNSSNNKNDEPINKKELIETLSWHETNEWHPTLSKDGRIIYCRWDYVDRNAARYHGLWLTNTDGTGAVSLFGNYTQKVCACYQPKEIPGSNKIMFVAGAHHLDVGGSLVILDPAKVRYDPDRSEDTLDCLEKITPEVEFPETPKQCPDTYYFSPEPLSEDLYLTAYSHDPLGGMLSPKVPCSTGKLGLYYRDRFGNLELIYDDPDFSCQWPMQIRQRDLPATNASVLPPKSKTDSKGTFLLSNVYESLTKMPDNRKIKELRVFQILPKYPGHAGHVPQIGHSFAGNARLLLGSVPVESDGSAHFNVPAEKPLYFQAVDESGRAVQSMRSEVYLQRGENRGCVGCHEQAQTTFKNSARQSIASRRKPSELKPGIDGTAPFSYPILVQSVLDRACVSCHSGKKDQPRPDLTGSPVENFTVSYKNLRPYLKWYEWGGHSIRSISTLPGECGADQSPLSSILDDKNHRDKIQLNDQDRRTLYLWMDANADFYGVYDPDEQKKQQRGEKIAVPNKQ